MLPHTGELAMLPGFSTLKALSPMPMRVFLMRLPAASILPAAESIVDAAASAAAPIFVF